MSVGVKTIMRVACAMYCKPLDIDGRSSSLIRVMPMGACLYKFMNDTDARFKFCVTRLQNHVVVSDFDFRHVW